MKIFKYIIMTTAAIAAMSCVKEENPVTDSNTELKLVPMTFTASYNVEENVDTKVALENGLTVWKTGDKIKVITPDGTATDFEAIEVTDEGKKATFEGISVKNAEAYYAVYPASAYKGTPEYVTDPKGGKLVVHVPEMQQAVAETFHPSALLCIANNKGDTFEFKHSCAFIKFNLANPEGVKSVRLTVNNSDNVAGIGYVGLQATDMNTKYASSDSNMSAYDMITLSAPENGFAVKTNYLIAMRANSCPYGITMYIEYEDCVKCRTSSNPVFVTEEDKYGSIGKIKNLGQLDKDLTDLNLYDSYNLGANVIIAGEAINKTTHGQATLISENTTITTNGVYFIANDVGVQISKGPYTNLFIIGNSLESKSNISLTEQFRYSTNAEIGLKNLAFAQYTTDMFVHNNTAEAKRFAFDNCKIIMPTSNGVMYNGANRTVNEFAMHNCDIEVTKDSQVFFRAAANYSNIELYNNIFYSREDDKMDFYLINSSSVNPLNLILNQNTFANVYNITSQGEQNPYITVGSVTNYELENNLFYLERYNSYKNPTSWILSCTPTTSTINNNFLFKDINNQRLQVYKGGAYTPYTATKSVVVTGEVDLSVPTIVPATTAGATR